MSFILESNRLNITSRRNIMSSYRNRIIPLTYNFVNFTSQDPNQPINNLLLDDNNKQGGWASNRYCTYPQEILIQFPSMVNIRQINILINESKIPKMIEFINCIPIGDKNKFIINNNNKSKIIPSDFMYENIGFIKLSTNTESNYKARELRKIYINVNTEYIKLKIHRNYTNNLNMFCQVGIVSLDFFGTKKEIKKKEKEKFIPDLSENNKISENETNIENVIDTNLNTDEIAENFIDDKMEKETSDKIKELIEDMNKKKENEEYDKCKCIKDKIDKIRKVALKIYTLEEEKKEYANKNEFDKAKEIKLFIEKIKQSLQFYLSEDTFNKSNANYKEKKYNNDYLSRSQQINNEDLIEYDEIILPVVMKKIQKQNNNSLNKSSNNNNNSGENSCDSAGEIKEDEPIEKKELEELDNSLKTKYELLLSFIDEETLRKIFSKYIYYKEEGFESLKGKVKEIINGQKDTNEANKYIITLIDIIFIFLDDKHPFIVFKCLEIFHSILEAIEEKSKQNKVSYDFSITKKILNKIKEKLNDISKKVRTKAADLYCFMLNTDFCEYNTLLIELIENEVINHFNKYLTSINKSSKYSSKYKLSYDSYNYNYNYINKHEIKSSKQLIITKMDIFLKVLENFDEAVSKNKTDKQKFPQNILGDFLIMNINHPKDVVREKTKDVMIKFIAIFGNKILNKMQMIIDDKELSKILQDKKELKAAYDELKKEQSEKEEKMKASSNGTISGSVSGEGEAIFLTNVNKKFPSKGSPKNKLSPILRKLNGFKKFRSNNNIINGKRLMHSSSQPKFGINKTRLKPIGKRNTEKILANSKSQNELMNSKNNK